jgi:hypothetical protein
VQFELKAPKLAGSTLGCQVADAARHHERKTCLSAEQVGFAPFNIKCPFRSFRL